MKKFISILVIFSTLCSTVISCSFAAETKAQPKTATTQESKINKVKQAGAAALAAVATAYGIKAATGASLKKDIVVEPEHWYTGILNWAKDNKIAVTVHGIELILIFCAWYFGRQGKDGKDGKDAKIPENIMTEEKNWDFIIKYRKEINAVLQTVAITEEDPEDTTMTTSSRSAQRICNI